MPSPYQERRGELLGRTPEIYAVPDYIAPTEKAGLYPRYLSQFNDAAYITNVNILRALGEAAGRSTQPEEQGDLIHTIFPALTLSPDKAIDVMRRLKRAPSINQTLPQVFPSYRSQPESESFMACAVALQRKFAQTPNPLITLSATHLSDFASVASVLAEQEVRPEEIWMWVVDRHVDIANANPESGPLKANFLTFALGSHIGGVSIFGPSHSYIENTTQGGITLDDQFQTYQTILEKARRGEIPAPEIETVAGLLSHAIYDRFRDKLFLEDIYQPGTSIVSEASMTQALHRQVQILKQRGVKYLFISFDTDGLNLYKESITATPYSHISNLLVLGVQDFTQAFGLSPDPFLNGKFTSNANNPPREELKRFQLQYYFKQAELLGQNSLPGFPNNLGSFDREGSPEKALAPVFQAFYKATKHIDLPLPYTDKAISGATVLRAHSEGLTVAQAESFINTTGHLCHGARITVGLPLKGGGRLLGSISELSGPDLDGNTARAVRKIASAINRATQ